MKKTRFNIQGDFILPKSKKNELLKLLETAKTIEGNSFNYYDLSEEKNDK